MKVGRREFFCAIIICAAAVFIGWWVIDKSKPRLQILQNVGLKTDGTVSFTLTNPTTVPYYYWVLTELKTNRLWNISPPVQVMHWEDRKELPPLQAATISVVRPTDGGKWRVTASCHRSANAPPALATRVADLLGAWNLRWVADKFQIYDKGILVSGPEMTGPASMDANRSRSSRSDHFAMR